MRELWEALRLTFLWSTKWLYLQDTVKPHYITGMGPMTQWSNGTKKTGTGYKNRNFLCVKEIIMAYTENRRFIQQDHPLEIFAWQKGWSPPILVSDRNGHGRKARDSRAKRGRNVRFWDINAARDRYLSRGCCCGRTAEADRGREIYAPQNNTPNRSLVALIITYMSHTSATEGIFNA